MQAPTRNQLCCPEISLCMKTQQKHEMQLPTRKQIRCADVLAKHVKHKRNVPCGHSQGFNSVFTVSSQSERNVRAMSNTSTQGILFRFVRKPSLARLGIQDLLPTFCRTFCRSVRRRALISFESRGPSRRLRAIEGTG